MNIKKTALIGITGVFVILTSCNSDEVPLAEFSASKTDIIEGENISFTDESSDNPSSWVWDFGDGNPYEAESLCKSEEQNPSHMYIVGTYTVSLEVTNNEGSNKEIKTDYIHVIHETGTFTDNRDNRKYKWVKIGTQTWMAENLAYTGDDIEHITENDPWEHSEGKGWCNYENKIGNKDVYGVLYQLEAAKIACPSGWHIPTNAEWEKLREYLIEKKYMIYPLDGISDTSIAKSLASDHTWLSTSNNASPGNINHAEYQNRSDFSALAAGARYSMGGFYYLNNIAVWWSVTKKDNTSYYNYKLSYNEQNISKEIDNELAGYSVRCIKD